MIKTRIKSFLAVGFLTLGVILVNSIIYPIAKSEAESRSDYPNLISPLSADIVYDSTLSADYTKSDNWFPGAKRESTLDGLNIKFYTVTIPSLRIKDATVSIGGEDLSESLIQYPGTALPGEIGNAVIFGHSVLPQYFDPENYISIFSTLPTIKKGAEVYISYDGITYTYIVKDKFEVRPTDIQVLEQNDNSADISLITCSPPGHPLKPKRLVVRAELSPNSKPKI